MGDLLFIDIPKLPSKKAGFCSMKSLYTLVELLNHFDMQIDLSIYRLLGTAYLPRKQRGEIKKLNGGGETQGRKREEQMTRDMFRVGEYDNRKFL
jgi:hypothetical protein